MVIFRPSAVALAVMGLALVAGGAEAPPFLECTAGFEEEPTASVSSECIYDRAIESGDVRSGRQFLEDLAKRKPKAGWPVYYRALLSWRDHLVAEALLANAAGRFQEAGDVAGEVTARGNRQRKLFELGRMEEARAEANRAALLAGSSGEPDVQAQGYVILGRHLVMVGEDLDRASRLLHHADRLLTPSSSYPLRREVLWYLSSIGIELGRFVQADQANLRLLELARDGDDGTFEALALYGLTRVSVEKLGEVPTSQRRTAAIELARETLRVAEAVGYSSVASKAHWTLGVLGPRTEAAEHLQRCADFADRLQDENYCRNALARHLAREDPEAGARLIEETLGRSGGGGTSWSNAFAWREVMRIRWAAAKPEPALEESWRALDRIEHLRDLQPEGSSAQADLFSTWSDDYAWLAGRILEEAGRGLTQERSKAEAFRVAERMRARALTDWLQRSDPEAAGAGAGAFSGLEAVKAALEPREALLSFQVAPWEDLAGDFGGGSWLLAVTRDAVTVHRLPGRVEVRRGVQLLDGLIGRRDGAEARVAARLYEQLLAPALAELPPEVDRLVLVPDDALHRLPFAALRASAEGEPLGARFELVQVPSATLWLQWRAARTAAPARPVLVLADPDSPAAGEAGAEDAVVVAQAVGAARVRDAAEALGRLPHARREGRAAVRALGDGLLLVGAEASEARLAALPLGDFGLVHFAAHALTDEDRPARSAVLLAPGDGADGLLQSAEIAGLDLAGRTVVLASCRSASGTVLRGEGVMSLARAFFQAGAHAVVASLWPLRDDESEALFGRVYRHLGRGASVGEALHRARREAIEAGEPATAWAGLVVLGDGAAAPLPDGRRPPLSGAARWTVLWVLLALALLAGAVAAWRLRTRRA